MKRRCVFGMMAGVSLLGAMAVAQESQLKSEAANQATNATVPRLVRFSGVLKDAAGKTTRGVQDVTFSLYAIESGGEPLWFETQMVDADALGRYTVLLGAMHPDGLPMDLFTSGEARWLGVSLGKLPEQSRVLLVAVPYALKAADADTVGGKPATAFVASDQLKDQVRNELSSQVSSGKLGGRTFNALIGTSLPQAALTTPTGTSPAITGGASSFACTTTTPCLTVSQSSTGIGTQSAAKTLGLYGLATQTTGTTYGVQGRTASTAGRGVFGYATAATGGTIGAYGLALSASGVGLFGDASAKTGATRGVIGRTYSPSGIGVFGQAAATSGGIGVYGQATATTGATTGVRGDVSSPNGVAGIFNTINPSGKILSGRYNGGEKFSVDGAGNVVAAGTIKGAGANFTGNVTGAVFVGDGSGLTVDGTTVAALLARIRDLQDRVDYLTPPSGRLWANRFGGSSGPDQGEAIAVDTNGDVIVTGHFYGTLDFGHGPMTSAGSQDIFIAKFSGVDGTNIWAKRFGDINDDSGNGIAVDESGNVLVTGSFKGTVNFGGGALTSAGSNNYGDIFIAKFSGVDGAHLWSKRFGDIDYDRGYEIVIDPSGNALVTGNFYGTVNFGGGALTSAGSRDIFVAKFSGTDGAHLWSKRFGDIDDDGGYGIAVDGSGDVSVTGYFFGTVNLGGGPLTSAGGRDIFVAKFSGVNGAHLWSKRFGDIDDDSGNGIAVDGSGNVLVTGGLSGTVDFGGGALTSAGSRDIFVAKFSGANGAHVWSKRFGDIDDDGGIGIAVDGSGDVLVTGYFNGAVNFGGGPLTSAGSYDIFAAKFSGLDGTHLWSKRYGDTGSDFGIEMAVDGSGNVLATGSFSGTVDFGGETLTSAGGEDIFVLKLRH